VIYLFLQTGRAALFFHWSLGLYRTHDENLFRKTIRD